MVNSLHATLVASLVAGASLAQLPKATTAPAFPFEKVWNDGPASFDALRGKLVIFDFAQTW